MLALAGYPLGLKPLFLDRAADTPGAQVAPTLIGELEDEARLAELAARSDVLTFDWENVPAAALAPLRKVTAIRPPAAALQTSAKSPFQIRFGAANSENSKANSRNQWIRYA